ncbi:gamma-crystallin M2-like [Salminus brasiliensis]|uniref:gamma-crystallin M2-like n=1 Tax=Salminus brasiliensis TaxID=930266 RepID=UPI003B83451B
MGKITFFEEKNFQGRCYEASGDCKDLLSFFSRCNSVRVESGCWVLYEKPGYKGYQYILSPGDYADHQEWMGFSDNIQSCRCIKNLYGNTWRLRLYERPDFGGQMIECTEDCPSVLEAFKFREVFSCAVLQGAWVFYELPGYRGRQYFVERGDYRKYTDWRAVNPVLGSFRRITEF